MHLRSPKLKFPASVSLIECLAQHTPVRCVITLCSLGDGGQGQSTIDGDQQLQVHISTYSTQT